MKQILNRWVALPVLMAAVTGLSSCRSISGNMRLVAQDASLESRPVMEAGDRLSGLKIVSVNGERTSRGSSSIASGRNQIKTRFKWPQGGTQEVDLDFEAEGGKSYYIKFRAFPPTEDIWAGNLVAEDWIAMLPADLDPYLVTGISVPIIAWALAERAYLSGLTLEQMAFPAGALYTDVFVISRDWTEGVVSRVRAYHDGRIDATTWKADDADGRNPGAGRSPAPRPSNSGILIDRSLSSAPR